MRRLFLSLFSVALVACSGPRTQAQVVGADGISPERARETVERLCAPELRGRGANDPGFMSAARWLGGELRTLGYRPLEPDGDFVRTFSATERRMKRFTGGPVIIREPVNSANVIGYLPGRTDEVIIIGAHLDHVGFDPGNPDVYAPGADDNASGVAAVLEVARALASITHIQPQRRGIVIAFWGAEEVGLLGSGAFVGELQKDFFRIGKGNKRIPFDLTDIVLVLNLDMVGRGFVQDDAATGGVKTILAIGANNVTTSEQFADKNPALNRFLIAAAQNDPALKFVFDDHGQHYFMRTDTYSFVQARPDISTLFFTGPEHVDYHSVTDTPDKLDYDRLARIAGLTLRIVLATWESDVSLPCKDCR